MLLFCEILIFFKSTSKSSLLTFLASSWSEWHRLWCGKLSLRDSSLFKAAVWVVYSWVLLTYSITLYILFKFQLCRPSVLVLNIYRLTITCDITYVKKLWNSSIKNNQTHFCMMIDNDWLVKPKPRMYVASFGNRSVNRTKMNVF